MQLSGAQGKKLVYKKIEEEDEEEEYKQRICELEEEQE